LLRSRARPATAALVKVIDEHTGQRVGDGLRWGVESIRAMLSEHAASIAPTTYYDARARCPSAREERDEQLKEHITRVSTRRTTGSTAPARCGRSSTAKTFPWPVVPSSDSCLSWASTARGGAGTSVRPHRTRLRLAAGSGQPGLRTTSAEPVVGGGFFLCPDLVGVAYVAFVIDAFARRHTIVREFEEGIKCTSSALPRPTAWPTDEHGFHAYP
jgi:hypothetical protein